MSSELNLLSPWMKPHSPGGLTLELEREVAIGHVLYGKPVKALAVKCDRDDVLFEIEDAGETKYALLHLTWTQKSEPLPLPTSTIFNSLDQWVEWMKADHDIYVNG